MVDFEHKHRCEPCDLVWEHDPGSGLGVKRGKYRPPSAALSHFCPGCSEPEFRMYFGELPVNVSHLPQLPWAYQRGEVPHGQAVGVGV